MKQFTNLKNKSKPKKKKQIKKLQNDQKSY